ncbi:MAG: heme o synthase [Planctomycetota bacterium]
MRSGFLTWRAEPAVGPMTASRHRSYRRWAFVARAHLELGKPRLSVLVVLTTAAGYILAGPQAVGWARLAWALSGTALAAWGANALNQWLERPRDARMHRTQHRPLPARRVRPGSALAFGLVTGVGGPLVLTLTVGPAAGTLAAATVVIYVALYTPLKVRTSLNTLVGAVVGAIPPLIGWQAAVGRLEPGAWVLAAILFVWQVPHFLALAWLHRADYQRGGFEMLPAVDPRGHLTACLATIYTLLLLPLSLALVFFGVAGWGYAVGAVLLGVAFALVAVNHERQLSAVTARRLFFASIVYLPLLLTLMMLDRGPA